MKAGLWWKMSRLIVFDGSGSNSGSDSDSCSGSGSGSGSGSDSGSAWHRAKARQGTPVSRLKKRQRSRECEIGEEDEDEDDEDDERPFLTRVFFFAHGWSSAIYKGRNGTSIKYYKNAPCMRLPRLCRVDTVKGRPFNKDPEPTFRKRWLLLVEEGHQKEGQVR